MKKTFFTILLALLVFTGFPAQAALSGISDVTTIELTDQTMPLFTLDTLANERPIPGGGSFESLKVATLSIVSVNYENSSTSAGPILYRTSIGSGGDVDAFSERFWRPSPFH